ncbi:MAG: NUDIX hydrolase [Acidimicrobiales bacterium]
MDVKEASTIVLARDTRHGNVEVLMLKRNMQSGYVPGAHIFPGGEVDSADYAEDAMALCHGITNEEASRKLGTAGSGLAWWVAAIRECFEEVGLLLATVATSPAGELVSLDFPEVIERFKEHRSSITVHPEQMVTVCRNEGLALAADRLHYFSRWITPHGAPRRYDTRFFLAVAPGRQSPLPDSREIVETVWITPQDALAQYASGSFDMLLPTVKTLEQLSRFDNIATLLEWAAGRQHIPAIQPRIRAENGKVTFLIPGNPGYEEADDGPPSEPVTTGALMDASFHHGISRLDANADIS